MIDMTVSACGAGAGAVTPPEHLNLSSLFWRICLIQFVCFGLIARIFDERLYFFLEYCVYHLAYTVSVLGLWESCRLFADDRMFLASTSRRCFLLLLARTLLASEIYHSTSPQGMFIHTWSDALKIATIICILTLHTNAELTISGATRLMLYN